MGIFSACGMEPFALGASLMGFSADTENNLRRLSSGFDVSVARTKNKKATVAKVSVTPAVAECSARAVTLQ